MRTALLLACLSLPATMGTAFAGSTSRDCQTADKVIVMGAGNSTNRVQIKIVDGGRNDVYDVPVKIMPEFDYNTEETDQTITAVPVSSEKVTQRKHQVMHVVHKDGTECDGREQWDDRSVQSYVLMGKNGESLANGSALDPKKEALKKVKYMTGDGYLVAQFQCHSYGVTSAGGCYADEGDKVTWRNEK